MSDSEHSTVTYTSVSILVEDDSDMGSPGVDAPPSSDYVSGPQEPEQAPPSPVYLPYVPEPVYPEYIPPEDDEEDEEEEEHLAPADYTVVALPAAAPTPNHEVGESSAAGAARQDRPAVAREDPYSVARGDLYGFVDRVDVAPGRPMSRELDYVIIDTCDDLVGAIEGVNKRVTNLSNTAEQETTIMYGMMEDAQDDRSLLRARIKL
ncbi:hypothetical protein Tco_0353429, partial [Tanacetum coccineum]